MTFEGNGTESVPPRRIIAHYHGDQTRLLFVAAAVVLIVAESVSMAIALPTTVTVIAAIALVVSAGVTNPQQAWIHWVNFGISVLGALYFGNAAMTGFRSGVSIFNGAFLYTEMLAVMSLVALYLTTRTLRGFKMRGQV